MGAGVLTFKSAKSVATIAKISALLKESGGASPRDLANATGMARQNVGSYLHHMKKLGLVVCTEEAVHRVGASTGSRWELVDGQPLDADQPERPEQPEQLEQPERDDFQRQVIVRNQWKPHHARSWFDCFLFGIPTILQERHA